MNLLKKLKYIVLIILILTLGGCTTPSGNIINQDQVLITGKIDIKKEETVNTDKALSTANISNKAKDSQALFFPAADFVEKIFDKQIKDNSGAYLVKFNKNLKKEFIRKNLLKEYKKIHLKKTTDKLYQIKLSEDIEKEILTQLKKSNYLDYIEPDHSIRAQTIPNDPYFSRQWNLKQLKMTEVWDYIKLDKKVKVAVIDTGIITDHPDLAANIGRGYDTIDDDNDPTDPDPHFSHGTHVAGIIAAISNNNSGIAGIAPNVEIMPIRVIGTGGGNISNLIEGISWAKDNGADIINLSLASSGSSISLKKAIKEAVESGITVIASSGNQGLNQVSYPAYYPEVISVGAVGPTGERAYYSNYGPELDLMAPGGDDTVLKTDNNTILSTAGPGAKYMMAQGTSMAAPHVSGIAALLYSNGIKNPEKIKKTLKKTATPLEQSEIDKNYYGAGLISPLKALEIKSTNSGSDENNTDDSTLDLTKVSIFTVNSDTENTVAKAHPDSKGNYSLSLPIDSHEIIAWLDINKDDKVNNGDYYCKEEISISADSSKRFEKNLTLKKVE